MKEMIEKAISLGLGLAVTGKEQMDKLVDELVEKGEMSRAESSAFVDRMVKKGEEARQNIDDLVHDRIQKALSDKDLATKEDIQRLEKRIEELLKRQPGQL
ncbi:phasin family protein [Paenibacillus senegalensis]|uniref:phasin family protein n=1 Tax=Paenibacillus senegalensis TaxID=1465766 RepID=UPI000289FECA|nr:ATP synthase subunit B [Paenibacillus senegalensis]